MASKSRSQILLTTNESSDEDGIYNTDRISKLPESLLSRILSMLETEEAIRTSVLSKRWRFLWTSITNIDFSDSSVFNSDIEISSQEMIERHTKFVNCVNRTMLLLNPGSINGFSLNFPDFSDVFHIDTWVSAAVMRAVRIVEMDLGNETSNIELPKCLFYSKTLEVLELCSGFVFNIPKESSNIFPNLQVIHLSYLCCGSIPTEGSKCFPVLKMLHLDSVRSTENDDFVTDFVGQCPLLEDLFIRKIKGISKIDVCGHALGTVEIDFPFFERGIRVHIDAPALKYLKIKYWNPSHVLLIKDRSSLVGAELIDPNSSKQDLNLFELFRVLSMANYLSVKISVGVFRTLPLFSNLSKLEIEINCIDFSVLNLLKYLNVLQHLVYINKGFNGVARNGRSDGKQLFDTCSCTGNWLDEDACEPECFFLSLKSVRICNALGCNGDLALVSYILKNAKKLEIMSIKTRLNQAQSYLLLQKISMFPRGSECKVEFCHGDRPTVLQTYKRRNHN